MSKKKKREADQRLCFRYTDSKIPLLSNSEISSLQPSSVAVQPGLCRTRLETRTLVFFMTQLICESFFDSVLSSKCWQVYELKRAIAILIRCLTEENPKEKEEEVGTTNGIPKV